MDEFIVWDKEHRLFANIETLSMNGLGQIKLNSGWEHIDKTCYTTHPYIGKKDINGKKIYADSSIVEFDFQGFGETTTETYRGFIEWNKDRFRYDINVFSHADRRGDNYIFDLGKCLSNISDLKITDTIQQNKLGLIK